MKTQARAILKAEGIVPSVADKVFQYAWDRLPLSKALQDESTQQQVDDMLDKETSDDEDFDQPFGFPPTWLDPNTEMTEWLSTIMHHLFLGVVRAVHGEFMVSWMKTNRKHSAFVAKAQKLLPALKNLCLSWLKMETLLSDRKFGKHVSKNHLAFEKVSKWLYGGLTTLQAINVDHTDPPDKEPSEYLKKEAEAWLRARRIPCLSCDTKPNLILGIIEAIENYPGGQWHIV
jgi:hypothetical protein